MSIIAWLIHSYAYNRHRQRGNGSPDWYLASAVTTVAYRLKTKEKVPEALRDSGLNSQLISRGNSETDNHTRWTE